MAQMCSTDRAKRTSEPTEMSIEGDQDQSLLSDAVLCQIGKYLVCICENL